MIKIHFILWPIDVFIYSSTYLHFPMDCFSKRYLEAGLKPRYSIHFGGSGKEKKKILIPI